MGKRNLINILTEQYSLNINILTEQKTPNIHGDCDDGDDLIMVMMSMMMMEILNQTSGSTQWSHLVRQGNILTENIQ